MALKTAIVQVRNDTLANAQINFSNNIIAGQHDYFSLFANSNNSNISITGTKNWFATGTSVTGLTNSLFGADPVFTNLANGNFSLGAGSPGKGVADLTVTSKPSAETYFQGSAITVQPSAANISNTTWKLLHRIRSVASDIGAFDSSTTGTGIQ